MPEAALSILTVITAVNFVLGTVILARGDRSISQILFALIALATGLWGVAIVGFFQYPDVQIIVPWVVYTHLLGISIPYLFVLFASRYPRPNYTLKATIIGTAIFLIAFIFLLSTDTIAYPTHSGMYQIGAGYPLYTAAVLLLFVIGYILMWIQYFTAQDKAVRGQLSIVFWGCVVSSSLALIPDLILPYFGLFSYTWLGPICTLIMVGSIFMAMTRYKLFNARVIVTELLSGSIILLQLIQLYDTGSSAQFIQRIVLIVGFSIASFYLIRSVYHEIEQRELIEKQEKELEEANERQEGLIHFISHEVKGALGKSVNVFSLILDGDYGPVPEKMRPLFTQSLRAARESVDMVTAILLSSSIKTGKINIKHECVDLEPLVRVLTDELREEITERGLIFNVVIPRSERYEVMGDAEMLKSHVLRNLMDNAIRYTPKGSIIVTLKREAGKIWFIVADTGVGITDEDKKRLFTEGGRGKDSVKVNVNSTGYGLFFAKQLVELHNGQIWAESDGPGKGSRFMVTFPPCS